jgi:serine/threonine-protein kinase
MTAPVQQGDVIDGKYCVDKVLGMGGMGVVVAATHTALGRKVAIKFLLPEALEHPEIVARFDREARAAATVKGRHVVHIIDVGKLSDGRSFMVMEHLDGEDLEHVLDARGALSVPEAISYLLQTCEALAEAHAANIVHRDLKPANLFLAKQPDRRSIIKVLDFGISKVQGDAGALTKTATAMGTPYYMSPEQLKNAKDVDARADIWSLGVILFELLSNVRPFTGESMPEIVAKILTNDRPLLRNVRADVPAGIEDIVNKCLRGDRAQRFLSVAELAGALATYAEAPGRESVARISRLLGAPSVPPAAPDPIDVPPRSRPLLSGPPTQLGGALEPDRLVVPVMPVGQGLAALAATPTSTLAGEVAPRATADGEPASVAFARTGVGAPAFEPRPKRTALLAAVVLVVASLGMGGVYMVQRGAASTSGAVPTGQSATPTTTVLAPLATKLDVPTTPASQVDAPPVASSVASSGTAPPPVAGSTRPPTPGVTSRTLTPPVRSSQAPVTTAKPPDKDPLRMDVK